MRNIFVHDYAGEDEIKKEALKKIWFFLLELIAVLERLKSTMEKNNDS